MRVSRLLLADDGSAKTDTVRTPAPAGRDGSRPEAVLPVVDAGEARARRLTETDNAWKRPLAGVVRE